MSAVAIVLHSLTAAIWVGGMFFAYVVLRPSVGGIEPPPERLKLWRRVFKKFFPWVWVAVVLLPLSGYAVVFGEFGGLAHVGLHIHVMQGLGWVMILLFYALYFGPYAKFSAAVEVEAWHAAAPALDRIRKIVGANLVIGLIVIAVGASGRWWP